MLGKNNVNFDIKDRIVAVHSSTEVSLVAHERRPLTKETA